MPRGISPAQFLNADRELDGRRVGPVSLNVRADYVLYQGREFAVPMYEYQCSACHHRFEVIQKFSDKPVKKCPKCGKAVERLVSSSSIKFKGTGWYVTDYAKRSGPTDAKGDAKAGKESASQSATAAAPEKSEKSKDAAK